MAVSEIYAPKRQFEYCTFFTVMDKKIWQDQQETTKEWEFISLELRRLKTYMIKCQQSSNSWKTKKKEKKKKGFLSAMGQECWQIMGKTF